MIHTPLTAALGISSPIVVAPLGRGSTPAFLQAVANAGSLGFVALMHLPETKVGETVGRYAAATQGQFGVNLTLIVDQRHRLAAALEAGARNVSVWQGDPAPYISMAKAAGARVFWTVGSPQQARLARSMGVDFIVAQGREAGGHLVGDASTMTLLPAVVDAAQGIPVIAAGGIVDGRGLAAAFSLGACGAWMGTRFVASQECEVHPGYKQSLVQAGLADSVETRIFDGGWPDSPHRVLKNSTWRNWRAAGEPAVGSRPGEHERIGSFPDGSAMHRYSVATPWADMEGDWEAGAHYAGSGAGLIHSIQPVRKIVDATVGEAQKVLEETASLAKVF